MEWEMQASSYRLYFEGDLLLTTSLKKALLGVGEAHDLKEGMRSKSKLIGVTLMEVRQISFSVDSNKSRRSKGFRNIEVNL